MITPLIGLLALGVGALGMLLGGIITYNEAWLLLILPGMFVEDVLS